MYLEKCWKLASRVEVGDIDDLGRSRRRKIRIELNWMIPLQSDYITTGSLKYAIKTIEEDLLLCIPRYAVIFRISGSAYV